MHRSMSSCRSPLQKTTLSCTDGLLVVLVVAQLCKRGIHERRLHTRPQESSTLHGRFLGSVDQYRKLQSCEHRSLIRLIRLAGKMPHQGCSCHKEESVYNEEEAKRTSWSKIV